MSEITGLIELVKPYGSPALVFGCWFLYHKSTTEQFNKMLTENFKLLERMIETNILNTALITEIKSLIINNQWCPYAKDFMKKGELNGKSNNNAT